jgi:pyruvate kinase
MVRMNYKVIITLGPASGNEWLWQKLLDAGTDAFRLNTSHLSVSQLASWLDQLTAFFIKQSRAIPVILDLQGSKWRLGQFKFTFLEQGQRIKLVYADSSDQPGLLPVPHLDFFRAVTTSGKEIVLDDAKIFLKISSTQEDAILADVIQEGEISANKGITYQNSDFRIESLGEKDRSILESTRALPFVRYAISYVKDALEVKRYRRLFGDHSYLIAKLERQPAIDQAHQIAGTVDEIWLCRGDMGAELGIQTMAETVHSFSEKISDITVPVMLAGQVLEHMTFHPAPTRSEVCYLYDALMAGYAGLVLSDETAIGKYPVESAVIAGLFKT